MCLGGRTEMQASDALEQSREFLKRLHEVIEVSDFEAAQLLAPRLVLLKEVDSRCFLVAWDPETYDLTHAARARLAKISEDINPYLNEGVGILRDDHFGALAQTPKWDGGPFPMGVIEAVIQWVYPPFGLDLDEGLMSH
jgi:hypothetical protein